MRYKIYLIFLSLSVLVYEPALAQDMRYRVEILVLTHLSHDEEPQELLRLEDYSAALDFLSPPDESEEGELDAVGEPAQITGESAGVASLPEEAAEDQEVAADVNEPIHIEEMGEAMQEAWRRLRLSGPFRPEQYLSWEQGDQEPFPTLRVHDLDVVLTEDPWAEARAELAEQQGETAESVVFADPAGLATLEEAPEPKLPDPVQYFRLDGTVSLTRSRFLHLALDLQLREAVWDLEPGAAPVSAILDSDNKGTEPPPPASFRVHSLKQRRQVKTGRMEYFDGPVLGVLAFITPVEINKEDRE